jgi:hypothetical protein
LRHNAVILLLLITTSALSQDSGVKFTDVTQRSGIDFRYTFGDFTYDNILESSGSGVTVFDYNGDGHLDLYMLNGTYLEDINDPKGRVFQNTPNRLYRNNGDGSFTEVSQQAGLDDRHWSMAAASMDYDGDGDTDIFLLNYGPNRFYLNEGDGTFTDVADKLGLRGPKTLNGFTKWSVGAAFWDFDRDGDADVMVGNFLAFDPYHLSATTPHLMPHPNEYRGQASLLYQQQPDGTFRDVTRSMGMYFPESKCMGLTVFDFDDDGDLDLFQGNDHQENFLFQNNGNGTFRDVARASGVVVNDGGHPTGSMHGSVGDVDGDGRVDLLVVDLRHGALYRNRGNGLFEDITAASGVKAAFRGKGAWAAAMFDYDNDGDLDILSANGMADLLQDQDQLLLENDGKGHFQNVGPERAAYFQTQRSARGAAVWDYDNDGDRDIIVSHIDLKGTPTLLRNEGTAHHHWLGLNLIAAGPGTAAVGAKVTVEAGDLRQVGVNQWATSYLSYNDPRMHFGLGPREHVDRVTIRWPSGRVQVIQDLTPDRYVTIVEGQETDDIDSPSTASSDE